MERTVLCFLLCHFFVFTAVPEGLFDSGGQFAFLFQPEPADGLSVKIQIDPLCAHTGCTFLGCGEGICICLILLDPGGH